MADPVADNADFAVDELRRKARRRLVGAIVLALAAATILPRWCSKRSKSRWATTCRSRFRRSTTASSSAASRTTKARTRPPAPRRTAGKAAERRRRRPCRQPTTRRRRREPASRPHRSGAAVAPGRQHGQPLPTPRRRAPAASGGDRRRRRRVGHRPAAGRATAPAADIPSAATARSAHLRRGVASRPADAPRRAASRVRLAASRARRKPEGYVVQLAAFTDDNGANALANRLKKAGYPAYTEPVETKPRDAVAGARRRLPDARRGRRGAQQAQGRRPQRSRHGREVTPSRPACAPPRAHRLAASPNDRLRYRRCSRVVVLSTLLAFLRGVVREVIALVSWIAALVLGAGVRRHAGRDASGPRVEPRGEARDRVRADLHRRAGGRRHRRLGCCRS